MSSFPIWLLFVGAVVLAIVVYLLSPAPGKRGYRSLKVYWVSKSLSRQKHEEEKIRIREREKRRRIFGWRRR
jgi:hypothetical protein